VGGVALAFALEGVAVAMEPVAVDLDDQALLCPEEVSQVAGDPDVIGR
jgi:hypothetical protein